MQETGTNLQELIRRTMSAGAANHWTSLAAEEESAMVDRERLEHLLREPNNLFGQPKGTGYDYGRAAITLAALAATGVSTAALLAVLNQPTLPTPLQAVLLIVAIPNLIGLPFLWPLNLLLGLVTSFLLWQSTIYVGIWYGGWRQASRAARWCAAFAVAAGWTGGAAVWVWWLNW